MRVNGVFFCSFWVGVFGVLGLLPGCSSSSDGGSGGASTPVLNPPATIDIKTCASITGDFETISQTCQTCCTGAGFSSSTSYDNKCVCGKVTDDETSCKDKDQTACPTCCTAAGYSGYGFFGDPGSSSCTCSGKFDDKVCQASAANGDNACQACCINNGYLGDEYSNFGTPECNCNN